MEIMHPITLAPDGAWNLIDKNAAPVIFGESYMHFRGEMNIITGATPPHKPGSSGRVYTSTGMGYYPCVFNMRWVQS